MVEVDEHGEPTQQPSTATADSPRACSVSRRRFLSAGEAVRELCGVVAHTVPLVRAYRGGLPGDVRERVMVAVSQVNGCADCARLHRRWASRSGVSAAELDAIGTGEVAHLDSRSRAAVVYAVERAERRFRGPPAAEVAAAAREHLSARQLEQVEAITRAMSLANLSLNTLTARNAADRREHPLFARVWARLASKVGSDEERGELLAGLQGRVLEVGAGDGRNFAHYPPEVFEVIAVEPEPYLRKLARRAASSAPVRVRVIDATAEALPLDDGGCDAAVASLVLCSVPDQQVALAELRRVLKPNGDLRFYEHVVARGVFTAGIQRALDGSGVWPRLGAGCHLSRDTVSAIEAAGFTMENVRRFPSGPGRLGIPFVLGTASLQPTAPTASPAR